MKTLKLAFACILSLCLIQATAQPKSKGPLKDFIPEDAEMIFEDDFNNEISEEFPSKWTHYSGNLQTNQVERLGKKEGVIEFIAGGKISPAIEGDYLNESFKIEFQCYFYLKGNESYGLSLLNENDRHIKSEFTIRSSGISHKSVGLARLGGESEAGWRTIQLSFNKGTLKVYYEGKRLVHVPNIGNDAFTHLTFKAASPGGSAGEYDRLALVNYFKIAKEGMPLYDQLTQKGKLIFQDIQFKSGSHDLQSSSFPTLGRITKMLLDHPELNIVIHGHTDSQGSADSNMTLSEKRAAAVRSYLEKQGINNARMKTASYGEEQPIDPANNESAWAQNRRVEITRG